MNNETSRLLCIQPTGAGKTLLCQTVATHLKAVNLYLSPLLSLSSNQVLKFMSRTRSVNTNITPVHLDKVRHKKELKSVTSLVKNAVAPTTVLIFASPQSLTDKFSSFVATIRSLIWFVVIDELHLFHNFGRSFRKEFTLLKDKMFSILRSNIHMLFMTAT